jgi:hypothetical protein
MSPSRISLSGAIPSGGLLYNMVVKGAVNPGIEGKSCKRLWKASDACFTTLLMPSYLAAFSGWSDLWLTQWDRDTKSHAHSLPVQLTMTSPQLWQQWHGMWSSSMTLARRSKQLMVQEHC